MTEYPAGTKVAMQGEVLDVDYDKDEIVVRLEDGQELTFPFEMFDDQDVYQAGQHFLVHLDPTGLAESVSSADRPASAFATLSGYVESVDPADELVWVYLRDDEGWHRKVMPLQLFADKGLDRPGRHFLLDLGEDGTPLELRDDERELEMQLQPAEETKPRWTSRPAAEAEPEPES
ncbi:MAG: hypothetical protein JO247_09125 [Chloroflexi bacterium]|nr:hypothetical protein [Chloroflexota bacterium]